MKQVVEVRVQQYQCFPKEWYYGAPPSLNFILKNTVLQCSLNIADQTSCTTDALLHP